MPAAPNMSNAAGLLALQEALRTQTEPVVYKEEPKKEIDQTGSSSRTLSSRYRSEYESEPCETEDHPIDRRPEWQKIASRGGRSRPNRKR